MDADWLGMDTRPPQPPHAHSIPLSIGERRSSAWATAIDVIESSSNDAEGKTASSEIADTGNSLPDAVLWPEQNSTSGLRLFPIGGSEDRDPIDRVWQAFTRWMRLPARFMALSLMAYLFAFNFSVVRGSSMAPGIHDGDRILIDQLSYLFTDIDRGDIVVLQYPLDPKLDYIKRVVGLPGDEVVLALGQLWINGERVDETYIDESDPFDRVHTVVKPGHYFVLGDNRMHSSDSREFGQVREELVRGKVEIRLWPPTRAGLLD